MPFFEQKSDQQKMISGCVTHREGHVKTHIDFSHYHFALVKCDNYFFAQTKILKAFTLPMILLILKN